MLTLYVNNTNTDGSEPYTSYSVMSGSQSPSEGDEQESDIDKKESDDIGEEVTQPGNGSARQC